MQVAAAGVDTALVNASTGRRGLVKSEWMAWRLGQRSSGLHVSLAHDVFVEMPAFG